MNPATAVAAIAANPGTFVELVAQLQDADNDRRKAAEAVFEALKEQPDLCITCLAQTLRTCQNVEARLFCSVMIRKVIYYRSDSDLKSPVLWDKCGQPVQAGTKQALLEAVVQEPDRNVASKICAAVSDLANLIYDKTGWPELMPTLLTMLTSNQQPQIANGLSVLADVASYLAEHLKSQLQDIVNMLVSFLGSGNKDVTVAAANAATSFIEAYEDAAARQVLSPLVQPMLAVLGQLLSAGDEDEARSVLEMFIVLAESSARFLRPHLIPLVDAMMRVAGAGDKLEGQTRQLAVEFLVSLCEAREQSPGMMRKVPNLARSLFELVMGFLLDIEDDPAWHSAADDANEDAGAGELYDPGQEYLDRLALSLGGKAVSDAAAPLLGAWIADPTWQKRAAVFICLAQIAEGCTKVMSTASYLEQLARMCVMGLNDQEPHVRWAACQALGQMCTDLGPELQAKHHASILPALMGVMDDFNSPRVQAHACAAIVNFSEGVETDVLPPYLDPLILKLLNLLQNGARLVQEGALTALASVADSSQDLFNKYYDTVMPLLMHILTSANAKEHRLMRAKALECISLVGMAVGRDKFRADARTVLSYMQTVQQAGIDTDDPLSSYMLQAGARLCKCLGAEFIEYLPLVLPSLLASASADPDVQVVDEDEVNAEDLPDDMEAIAMGDKCLMYRSSILEEKATAVNMLSCYAEELREGFWQYVGPVLKLVLNGVEGQSPLIKFYLNEEIRRSAAALLPSLLRCCIAAAERGLPGATPAATGEFLRAAWGPLLEALRKEPEGDIQAVQLDSISEIVEMVENSLLTADAIAAAFKVFDFVLDKADKRRAERASRRSTEDFDAEEAEALEAENELEEELFDQVATAVGAFLKKFGDDVLPLVESLLMSRYGAMLTDKSRSSEERRIAICLVDDLLENSPAGMVKHFNNVLPMLIDSARSDHADLRQCAVYGLGVMAAKAPVDAFRPHAASVAEMLAQIIRAPDARSDDNDMATDNTIAALGRILKHHAEALGADGGAAAAALWVGSLPLKSDAVEATAMHEQLVAMCEANDPRVVVHPAKLASVFAEVLGGGKTFVAGPVGLRMAQLLLRLQGSVPAESIQAVVAGFSAKQQASYQAYMSGSIPE
ncbi:hypothetical protein HYH03_011733 [Edaphochlamys debaryana]|uniref:TOG domain-containing protein n=1 Tax=Edaphochlamys debaryana TaxID=47281 RepID=A0A835XT47_9CHLO|nr:hypothetical protein HYH03_011733 [Edaphochlamys debaryana]|eukprot:KAG2489783.1 hypothetical protein HYH03_011733 [Edaphochlamys debaryana]